MNTALTTTAPALDLVGGQHLAATASTLCGKALWALLTESGVNGPRRTPEDVSRAVAASPSLKAKVREVVNDLQDRATKAEPVQIMALLVEHTTVYGLGNKSPAEYEALFAIYLRALAPLPVEAIREAFVVWGRDGSGFYPKPEQLFQRAEPFAKELWMAAYRAKRAAAHVESNPPPKTDAQRRADIEAAKAAGIIGADGKVILNFKTTERRVGPPGESKQAMADRLRRIASGEEPLPQVSAPPPLPEPPEDVEEAI